MPKKSMETLTESMFYVLMALRTAPMCGTDAAEFIEKRTHGRVQMGPATLYTILAKFEKEGYIRETEVEGRKRTYAVTAKGEEAYAGEMVRLYRCVMDAEAVETSKKKTAAGSAGQKTGAAVGNGPVPEGV